MSFEQVDSGDLASFAAIAESTLANKEGETNPPQEEQEAEKEKSDKSSAKEPENEQTNIEQQQTTQDDTADTTEETSQEYTPEEASQGAEQAAVSTSTAEVTQEVASSESHLPDGQQESTYANLQPIFLAMEMGQTSQHEGQPTTTADISQQTQTLQVSQAITEQGNQLPFSQPSSVLLNSLTTSVAEGSTSVSLQSILQDVVSGIPTTSGTVPAAIITDPSSSTGSYLIVNQNGIPIVRPVLVSNMPENGMSGSETLQVLATGIHGMEGGDSQEPVTVEVSANTDGSSAASGIGDVDPDSSMGMSSEEMSMRVQHHSGSGDEESTPSRLTGGKRKLSDGPRVCEECNKSFKYPSDLKKHLQIHTNVKKFKCDDCGRLFRRLHQLNVHMRIHTGEKPYVCSRCNVAFRHDSTLTMHIRTRHDHLRPFKCDECGNTFGRLSHLRKHVRKVCGNRMNKDRPIAQCRFCEENFPTKGDLRKHVLTCERKEAKVKAKEVTLHVCDQCSKDFASPYNLRRHQLTHTDEKPFQCEVCARQFKEKSSLSKHMKRKHTGVDQGSQTDETGETEYNSVDVIAESAAASGVPIDSDDDQVESMNVTEVASSTVDASTLITDPSEAVRVQGQEDVEMTTIELSLPPGAESHEATALQAAVEALVSASQQQMSMEHSIVVPADPSAGKEIYSNVADVQDNQDVGMVDSTTELVTTEVKATTPEDNQVEYVEANEAPETEA
ncbi:zinc finger and BTB domain-containing protein 24-like [Actinia tenebrosa]|uniref:Zinc finger and BTB domain-containing protein 24-like n=1 Tax=Actinia tenebrosa TaxID=6105 RepID=A0A6P8IL37_ACTTE|nr:zinc finger and BTB domain-containing protein 24-like [Actinia tenebrosa]